MARKARQLSPAPSSSVLFSIPSSPPLAPTLTPSPSTPPSPTPSAQQTQPQSSFHPQPKYLPASQPPALFSAISSPPYNADAVALEAAMHLLTQQRARAHADLQTLERVRNQALAQPERYARALLAGKVRQVGAGVPMRAKSQGHGQDRESAALRSERSSAGLEGGVGRDPLGELPSNGPRKGSGNRRGAVIGNGYSNGRSNSHRRGHFNGHRSSRSTSSTDWRPQNRTKRSLDAEHTTSEAEEKPQYQHHRHEQHPQEEVKDEELDEEPFEALPVPQAITRCPVIDWEKYHVVGSGLEKLHRQEVLDPSVRAGDPVGSSSRYGERGVAMARFSPWKDVVD